MRKSTKPLSCVDKKLKEAEYQAASTKKRYTHEEIMAELRNIIGQKRR